MKLNPKALRYMTGEEFRTLSAVETGGKNHVVVPTVLISSLANLRAGGAHKILGELARMNLVSRVQNIKYDGYRLTYGGFDFLALKVFANRGTVASVGYQIGVGKESDIYIVADGDGSQFVLKLQRLGRMSFRTIKNKRDYLRNSKNASWMTMSRLGATKEYAFMKVLHENGFPVPRPIDHNRHCIVMELVDGFPLYQVDQVPEPGRLYAKLMDLIVRFARSGLIHGDFNEFNIMILKSGEPLVIDFPQMVSTSHYNAEEYFNRDVECIRVFFRKRFHYESSIYPRFAASIAERDFELDVQVAASGFTKAQQKEFEDLTALQDGQRHDGDGDSECSEELIYESEEDADEQQAVESVEEVNLDREIAKFEDISLSPEVQTIAELDDEDHVEEEQVLEVNDNRSRLPFRDVAAVTPAIRAASVAPSIAVKPAMSVEEIREKVKRQMKREQDPGKHRNITKGRSKNKNIGVPSGNDGW